ncbi:MAG: SPOR domain-containing protein [Gammaproteobacteria bacterium]|nr:SPOR domain-containing protein [Gammaproteobacteria bacterium]
MSTKTTMPGYVWLFAGLAIGLFIAFLVYLQKQPTENISFTQAIKQELDKARTTQATKEKSMPEKNTGKAPRFDFYTILPELEVFIPESELTSSGTERPEPSTKIATGKQYLLQAGSFRNNEDADKLKASLALLGIQSNIQDVTINNDTWHRVRIGPFNKKTELQNTLSTLKNNNIHAMTMELKN